MTLSQADLGSLDSIQQNDFTPFDPIAKRTEATLTDLISGEKFKTTKGAPHIIMALTNNENVKRKCEIDVTDLGKRGVRCLAVAKTDKNGKNSYLLHV